MHGEFGVATEDGPAKDYPFSLDQLAIINDEHLCPKFKLSLTNHCVVVVELGRSSVTCGGESDMLAVQLRPVYVGGSGKCGNAK